VKIILGEAEKLIEKIEKTCLLKKGDTVLVALSGGPDSTALLLFLHEIKTRYDLKIFAVHVNYHLRGAESERDEKFIEKLCLKLRIPVAVYSFETKKIIGRRSLQDFARELRYKVFSEEAKKVGAGKVAVAHNKNDRAETVLMRLLRGSHTAGLSGIPIKRKLSGNAELIRPLFNIERKELDAFLRKKKIRARTDKSNLKTDYLRNKIRLSLLPFLKKEYNPQIEDNLIRLSVMSALDESYFVEKAGKYIEGKEGECFVRLSVFDKVHPALRYRILRELLLAAKGNLKGVENKHLSAVVSGEKSVCFPGGLTTVRTNGKLLALNRKTERKPAAVRLKVPGVVSFGDYRVAAAIKDKVKCFGDKNEAYFDVEKVVVPLYIRERRAGDRFVPFGMKTFKKLQDYMVDEKIPKHKRGTIPVVTDKRGNILWIAGCRPDDRFKVGSKTKKVLYLKLQEGEEC
jgi:tRNA(Ile)-lysidine synthase